MAKKKCQQSLTIVITLCFALYAESKYSYYENVGCNIANCTYAPTNVMQFFACAQATKAGPLDKNDLQNCSDNLENATCSKYCKWFEFNDAPYAPGFCFPIRFASPPNFATDLMSIYLKGLKEMKIPEKDIPSVEELSWCLRLSGDRPLCDNQRNCGSCTVNVLYYPFKYEIFNPDQLCMHQRLLNLGACDALKGNLTLCSDFTKTTTTTTTTTTSTSTKAITSGFTPPLVDISFLLLFLCALMELL